jgi:hypothetical protein
MEVRTKTWLYRQITINDLAFRGNNEIKDTNLQAVNETNILPIKAISGICCLVNQASTGISGVVTYAYNINDFVTKAVINSKDVVFQENYGRIASLSRK